jgi:hypothetical protein
MPEEINEGDVAAQCLSLNGGLFNQSTAPARDGSWLSTGNCTGNCCSRRSSSYSPTAASDATTANVIATPNMAARSA